MPRQRPTPSPHFGGAGEEIVQAREKYRGTCNRRVAGSSPARGAYFRAAMKVNSHSRFSFCLMRVGLSEAFPTSPKLHLVSNFMLILVIKGLALMLLSSYRNESFERAIV